jgi:integrase
MFYIARNKEKKNGKCPVMGRITVDGKSAQFSVQEDIEPKFWSVADNRSTGKGRHDRNLNHKLEQYRIAIAHLYEEQITRNGYVTADGLKAALSMHGKQRTIMGELDVMMEDLERSVGVRITKGTYDSYRSYRSILQKFLLWKFHTDDYPLERLDYSFIESFDMYLKTVSGSQPNTVHGHTLKLRMTGRWLRRRGLLPANPFEGFVICQVKEDHRKWLSKEELDRIMQTPMKDEKANLARNMFVFSCFVGLSYSDIHELAWENITKDEYGVRWIRKLREKTGVESIIPLLPIPLAILERYGQKDKPSNIFGLPAYRTSLHHLGKVRKACGFTELGFHTARHTFATTVCLSNGLPIETLSRELGHSDISTTQIYGKITNRRINDDMTKFEQRVEGKFQFNPVNGQK